MSRLLWVPDSAPGGLFPAIPIVIELLARGHEVTALCREEARATLESIGCRFREARSLDTYLPAAGRPEPAPASKRRWLEGYAQALFQDATEELRNGGYELVLADPLEVGGGFAAEAAGVPWISYVHHAMDEAGADTPFCFHFWERTRPPADDFVEWWNGLRAVVGLATEPRPLSEHLWYRYSPTLTMVLGLPELVHPRGELPGYVHRVGPCLWEPALPDGPPGWIEELRNDRRLVLISVSTTSDADLELIAEVGEAARAEGLDVVATVPGASRPRVVPANVRLAPFVPHGALLPKAGLVASQAGNGTVTRAACAGIPQLLFPDGRDRFNVARGAVAAGAAMAIEPPERRPETIRQALRQLMTEETYRERAAALAEAAAGYSGPALAAAAAEDLLKAPISRPV